MNPEERIPANSRAILVGVSQYRHATYQSYPEVANSLRGMLDVLTDPDLCGWPQECVEPILDPGNGGQLVGRLRKLAAQTTGVLLFYFVGHGVVTEHGDLCLAISDTDADNPDTTGLEYSKIKKLLYGGGSPARTRIAILDCCFSGRVIGLAAAEGQLADLSDVAGTYTLTAADDIAHVVRLNGRAEAYTSFSGELLDLIRCGVPDGPDELTLGDLYPHLRHRLMSKNLPRPNQRGTDNATQFVFTRNARTHTLSKQSGVPATSDASDTRQKRITSARRPTTLTPERRDPVDRAQPAGFLNPALPGRYPNMIPVFDGDQLRFWLSQHLVTNGQFDTFLQAEENAGWQPMVKQYDQGYRRYWRDDGIDPDLEHHPVVNVSVKGACAYARWVGQQIGRPLRLPRVSEWERAAIAGRPDRWLDDEMAEGRVNYSRTLGKPARVGDFGVNPYGISDLIGNVFDLCLDDGGSPVLCGGTFRSTRERLGEHLPMDSLTRRRPDVGFRCAYDEHDGK